MDFDFIKNNSTFEKTDENNIDNLQDKLNDLSSLYHFIPGNIDLNECLEFTHKPHQASTITYIQEHFGFLAIQALKSLHKKSSEQENECNDIDITAYSCELTILGENGYTTTDLYSFAEGIFRDIPNADGFKIKSNYSGSSLSPHFNNELKDEFNQIIDQIGISEDFTYTAFEFLYNHGEANFYKYENGNWVDLEQQFSSDIVDCAFESDWWCWNLDLCVDFDFEKYPTVLTSLHQIVRKHIPSDQLAYCEDAWNNYDPGILLDSIVWYPGTLRPIQNFLDEIYDVLKAIMPECECRIADMSWYQVSSPFAIASLCQTDEGLKIKGTCL